MHPEVIRDLVVHNTIMDSRWNHNVHYQPILLDAVPKNAEAVLDVGCGVGMLTRALRSRANRVVGIDLDQASIALARDATDKEIEYVVGDFFSCSFALQSFDAVLSVATLHHVDAVAGLRRMRELVRPGGIVGVIGLARDESLADYAVAATGLIASWVHKAAKGYCCLLYTSPSPRDS